jgi:hypothetical protein
MRLAKDIFSPAEFWIESQFTPCVSCNGCKDCLELSSPIVSIAKVLIPAWKVEKAFNYAYFVAVPLFYLMRQ